MRSELLSIRPHAMSWAAVELGPYHVFEFAILTHVRKTTTMMFKMLAIQRAWELYESDKPRPRQIFVTHSAVLVEKVSEYFSKLLQSLASPGLSRAGDGVQSAPGETLDLLNRQDLDEWRTDLPTRFSELNDAHFPLFLTFRRVSND